MIQSHIALTIRKSILGYTCVHLMHLTASWVSVEFPPQRAPLSQWVISCTCHLLNVSTWPEHATVPLDVAFILCMGVRRVHWHAVSQCCHQNIQTVLPHYSPVSDAKCNHAGSLQESGIGHALMPCLATELTNWLCYSCQQISSAVVLFSLYLPASKA